MDENLPHIDSPAFKCRKRSRRSAVWDYFTAVEDIHGRIVIAYCNRPGCNSRYRNPCGTSTLLKHAISKHGLNRNQDSSNTNNTELEYQTPMHYLAPSPSTSIRHDFNFDLDPVDEEPRNSQLMKMEEGNNEANCTQQTLTKNMIKSLAAWIIDRVMPISDIESDKFNDLLRLSQQLYTPVSRAAVQRQIRDHFSALFGAARLLLSQVTSKIALSVNYSSRCIPDGSIAITAHWISHQWTPKSLLLHITHSPTTYTEDYSRLICNIVSQEICRWQLKNRVISITSDFEINMQNSCQLLRSCLFQESYNSPFTDGYHIPCLAHAVQLGAKEGLDMIKFQIQKIYHFILSVHRLRSRKEYFEKLLIELDYDRSTTFPPIRDIRTDWLNIFKMVNDAFQLRKIINTMCNHHEWVELQSFNLTDTDWNLVHTLCQFLEKAIDFTMVQGQTETAHLSLIPNAYQLLLQHCQNVKNSQSTDSIPQQVITVAHIIYTKLSECSSVLDYNIIKIAKLVDPRFPNNNISAHESNLLRQILLDQYDYKIKETVQEPSVLDTLLNIGVDDGNVAQDDEVYLFFKATGVRDVSAKPLQWWKDHQKQFPTLSKLARDLLCIPLTCATDHFTTGIDHRYQLTETWVGHQEFMYLLLSCRNWTGSGIVIE